MMSEIERERERILLCEKSSFLTNSQFNHPMEKVAGCLFLNNAIVQNQIISHTSNLLLSLAWKI